MVHGGNNDVVWLQRDFHIYIVNAFDTEKACQVALRPKVQSNKLLQLPCQELYHTSCCLFGHKAAAHRKQSQQLCCWVPVRQLLLVSLFIGDLPQGTAWKFGNIGSGVTNVECGSAVGRGVTNVQLGNGVGWGVTDVQSLLPFLAHLVSSSSR